MQNILIQFTSVYSQHDDSYMDGRSQINLRVATDFFLLTYVVNGGEKNPNSTKNIFGTTEPRSCKHH